MQEGMLEGFRLSPQQRHLWGLLQEGNHAAYQAWCAVAIKGRLNHSCLESAAESLIARHEILRTSFRCLPGMTIPMQVINETGDFIWKVDELCALDPTALSLDDFLQSASHTFDLQNGPFLSIHLIKRSEDDHVMIVSLPAICADSVGLRNLIVELGRGYAAAIRGEEPEGDVLQYADLAEWQNDLVESEATRIGREYWENLKPLSRPLPQLASERRPEIELRFEPLVYEREIAPSLATRIESIARSRNTSFEKILLACWYTLLWRHTGQPEIEIGAVFDGRRATEIEDALGLFAKHLPVSCRLEEGLRFSELVDQIDEVFVTVSNRQEYFYWDKLLPPTPAEPMAPFFPFCFERETKTASFIAGDISFTTFKLYSCLDRFRIKLSYALNANGLVLELHYNSELFRASDAELLAGQFQSLLRSAVANPEARLDDLEMMTDAEKRQIFTQYNSAMTGWHGNKFVHEQILNQMKRTPDAVAVLYEAEHLTYRELNERTTMLASYLRDSGVGPEVVVGICMGRCLDLVVSVLAVLKAAGAYLPLDPSYPQERLAYMLEDAAVTVLLTQDSVRSRLPKIERAKPISVETLWETIHKRPVRDFEAMVLPDNLAYVIYTSGSTGKPKGVMLRHRSLTNYLLWAIGHYPLERGWGSPVHSSLSFDLTITSLFTPLLVGSCVHLLSTLIETEALGAAIVDYPEYSLVKLTPAHLQLLTERLGDFDFDRAPHSFVIGGENLPAQTVKWWRQRAPAARLFNEYGPTEAVVGCCVYEIDTQNDVEEGRANVPIGRPIANAGIHILDGARQPSPEGIVGELCISGEGLARGYLNHPDLTAEKFRPSEYLEERGARLYLTGDLARYLRDGQIEVLGRIDGQVKVRGYRIELGEIEAALRDVPEVREAVVMAVSEGGQNRLIAYITAGEKPAVDYNRLRRYLRQRLPEYMIPSAFTTLDALPLTANGKIDRKRLPAVKDGSAQLERGYTGARTPVESMLASTFGEVLKVSRVGIHDNFFDLGGHSLLATQVTSRVREVFGVGIGVRSIFEDLTVARLAKRIEEALRAGEKDVAPPLVKAPRADRIPLSFAQQRMWFIDQLEPGSAAYNIPCAVRLRGDLDTDALRKTLNEIVARHEVLRTSFPSMNGQPRQEILEPGDLQPEYIDLSAMDETEREIRLLSDLQAEAKRGFDLASGRLIRAVLIKLAINEHVFMVTMHHMVSDGWSLQVIVREFAHLYEAFSQGQESPLRELEIQYADYAVWQRGWLRGEVLEAQREYWRKQLQELESLALPTDRPRPSTATYRGASERIDFPEELMQKLRQLSKKEGVTVFMTLLAGFQLLLARYSGQEDIAIGTPIAGRNTEETERLIGLFLNTLVMRVNVGGNPSVSELLARVKEAALGAYAHQDIPFEKLVEEIRPERNLSHQPLFQIWFVMQNIPAERIELQGLSVESLPIESGFTKFDLMLSLNEGEKGLTGSLRYSTDLFARRSIRRLLSHYERILEGMAAEEETDSTESETDGTHYQQTAIA